MRWIAILLGVATACSSSSATDEAATGDVAKLDAIAISHSEKLADDERDALLMLCALDRDYAAILEAPQEQRKARLPTRVNGKEPPAWLIKRLETTPGSALAVEWAEISMDILRSVGDHSQRNVQRLYMLYLEFRAASCRKPSGQ